MTQRKIERISGWIALGCWAVFVLLAGILLQVAMSAPRSTVAATAGTPGAQRQPGKHLASQATTTPVAKHVPSDQEIVMQVLVFPLAIAFVVACGATSWWKWRRRQRVRYEIRAEASDGRRRASRLGNGRAAGV